jgi:hypothetical protein
VTICDDTVQTDLVEVRRLELQHLVDARAVYLIRGIANIVRGIIGAAKARRDQLLAELVEQIECPQMGTARDLDQLGETVTNLSLRKTTQELEVEEGVHRGMVCSKTVLVVAVVHGDLDADTGIDEANDSSWDTDEVGTPSVCRTSKSTFSS